MKDFWR